MVDFLDCLDNVAVNDATIGGVQADRNALIELVKPDIVPYDQPLVIRYQGETDAGLAASDPVDIKCVYVSGLDTGLQRDFERANIVFEIQDAYLQKDGNRAVSLDYNDTLANADYIVKRDRDGVWSAMAGVTGTVRAIAQHPITKQIYIGGDGLNNGADPDADYLAKWDEATGTWVAVVAGITDIVYALAFDLAGNLYIGGEFTDVGDANGDGIVKFDGSSLSSLDIGLQGIVFKITIDKNGYIWAGGTFLNAGGDTAADYIAYFNGTAWANAGGAVAPAVSFITVAPNGYVYFGSKDVTIPAQHYIYYWDGSARTTLLTMDAVSDSVFDAYFTNDGNMYVIGNFDTINGISANYFARYNGQKWEALGDGLNGIGTKIVYYNDKFYLSGTFTSAGDVPLADRIAVYLGNGIYQPLDINLPGTPTANDLLFDHLGNLYVGFGTTGDAETAGDDTITNAGTAKTYPVITVTGPGLLRQIVNTTTGKGMYFNSLTLLAGEVVTLDLRPGRISMKSNFRGSVLSYVLPGSSYDFPLMPGINRIATFIDGTTTAATKATMQWKENYHGIDGASYA